MLSDIEIARSKKMLNIYDISHKLNIEDDYIEPYGKYKAKVSLDLTNSLKSKEDGKLILVTAITPTPLGEGKSTTAIGLVDALNLCGKNALGCLREPSLGPVFGVKGGACGGGYAQVNPMDDINLHFTGDLHAITSANNLISACIDNHIFQGNELGIDPNRIVWKRCVDLNDRALRKVQVGLAMKKETPRIDNFNITVASEIMAVFCLSKDFNDLRYRLDNLLIAYNFDGKEIYLKDLHITGSVLVLLKDAFSPNLVQTLENNPIIIHGGPFANIAHGCNSLVATKMGLKLADYVVTEAGFGADLGAEKFLDIKTRVGDLKVSCVVLVATLKALKYHGGVDAKKVKEENVEALKKGLCNLEKHIDTLNKFELPYVVCLNHFSTDTDSEIEAFDEWAKLNNVDYAYSDVFLNGGEGGKELAEKVINKITIPITPKYIYNMSDSIENKIKKICMNVYGAKDVVYNDRSKDTLLKLNSEKYKDYYICMAKTPLSLSDNPKLVGRPSNFDINITEIRIAEGAKFIICLTGDVMTMPGLPKDPLATKIDLDKDGNIINLS